MRITELPAGKGVLGLTLCPGILLDPGDPPAPERRLSLHLEAVKDWGAAALVSLLEEYEFELLNITRLGVRSEALGMDWLHLPIEHHALPDEWFEIHWPYAGHRILNLLQKGNKVAIHCRAGFGRTGTVAARILSELGACPSDAVEKVERVQASLQNNNLRTAYMESLGQPQRNCELEGRVLGCLLGGAVGDALGYDQELDEWHEIRDQEGQVRFEPRLVRRKELRVSHATQMSLFTLEGLKRADLADDANVFAQIRLAYLDWLQTQERQVGTPRQGTLCLHKELQVKREPSSACLSSLATGGDGTLLNPINQVRDCGALVRAAPLGLVPQWDLDRTMGIATQVAAITHGHPEERWGAAAMAGLVNLLCKGQCLQEAGQLVCNALTSRTEAAAITRKLTLSQQLAQNRKVNPLDAAPRLGTGTTPAEALAIGFYYASSGRTFEEALMFGANQIENSHVVAALTGQLYGAAHNVAGLSHAWVRRLDVYSAVNTVIFSFLGAF